MYDVSRLVMIHECSYYIKWSFCLISHLELCSQCQNIYALVLLVEMCVGRLQCFDKKILVQLHAVN